MSTEESIQTVRVLLVEDDLEDIEITRRAFSAQAAAPTPPELLAPG